jgi:hypothetical protein
MNQLWRKAFQPASQIIYWKDCHTLEPTLLITENSSRQKSVIIDLKYYRKLPAKVPVGKLWGKIGNKGRFIYCERDVVVEKNPCLSIPETGACLSLTTGNDNINNTNKFGFGHGRARWQTKPSIEQIFCDRTANNPRRITLLTPYWFLSCDLRSLTSDFHPMHVLRERLRDQILGAKKKKKWTTKTRRTQRIFVFSWSGKLIRKIIMPCGQFTLLCYLTQQCATYWDSIYHVSVNSIIVVHG